MTNYRIESKQGEDHGIYQGESPEHALAAMHRDAGYSVRVGHGHAMIFEDIQTAEICGGLKDWVVTEVKEPTEDQVRELCVITTRDEAGRHFTEWSEHWESLEDLGLITVRRPVHEQTSIPYSQEYWDIQVTEEGQDLVDANEELWPVDNERMTMRDFRERYSELDGEFEWLSRYGYDFDDSDQVEIVEQGRQHGGHLRLSGPGYAIQFSQGEPIVSDR